MTHKIEVTVNGSQHALEVEARRTLADSLRHDLELTGTHVGCEHGVCGACTVIVDGDPVRSCLMLAVQADGCEVQTIEGLVSDGQPSKIQQAFSANSALQCGFCTPGFLMLTTVFLREHPNPSDEEIERAVTSNLCRCTGYQGILAAVRAAADALAERDETGDARD